MRFQRAAPLFREQLDHADADDPFWAPVSFRRFLDEWTVPTLLVDGWHDYPSGKLYLQETVLPFARAGEPVHTVFAFSRDLRVARLALPDLLTGMWTALALIPGVGMPSDCRGLHTTMAATR